MRFPLHRIFWSAPVLALVLIVDSEATAKTWYVNNEVGRDVFDGLSAEATGDGIHGPFATFKHAVAALHTSDRLEVAKTKRPYREMLVIGENFLEKGGIGGTPEKPLVIEGNGAAIDGLDFVPSTQWTRESNGTFSTPFVTAANKLERVMEIMTWIGDPQIWFVDGQPAPNAKSAAELSRLPGGFYWNKGEHKLYYRPPPGKTLEDVHVEIPVRGTGINVYGTDYVVIQNFRTIHSLNDGVGTGTCIGVVFRNIEASDNCDQGFSAHNGTINIIENCRFERNAGSGICDVYDSVTIYRRCLIAHNSYEAGAYFQNNGFHVLEDCQVVANGDGPQVFVADEARVELRNCVVQGKAGNFTPLIESKGGNLKIEQCTVADGFIGMRMDGAKGTVQIDHSIFAKCANCLALIPAGAERQFRADSNVWHLGTVSFGGIGYTADNWDSYFKVSGNDANSVTVIPHVGTSDASDFAPGSTYQINPQTQRRIGADSSEWRVPGACASNPQAEK